jgi:hypothetical protein
MQHTSTAHVFTFATLGLIAGTACQVDANGSDRDGDLGLTVDTGRLDAGAPDVAIPDAVPADAIPDAGIDAAPPPLPPGCEMELGDLPATGAGCGWREGNPTPPGFDGPFAGRAFVEAVVEDEVVVPVFRGTPPSSVQYQLRFDDGFPVQCSALGTALPWARGDEVWLETEVLGEFVDGENAVVTGLFRPGVSGAPFDVLVASHRADLVVTRAHLARLGVTLTHEPICPLTPWPNFGAGDVHFPPGSAIGRELAFTFANGAGDTLTLRRGEQGEIGLSDGRRARIVLTMAREYQPDPNTPYVGLYHSFLLTIAP